MLVSTGAGVIKFLIEYGRLEKKDAGNSKVVRAAVKKYQQEFGSLEVDGVAGPKTKKAMNCPRCGVSDRKMMRENLRWKKDSFTFTILQPVPSVTLSPADQRDLIFAGGNKWAAVCGIKEWREAKKGENADVVISIGRGRRDGFDGPGRTLAWAELPDGTDQPKRLKYDADEIWVGSVMENGIPFSITTDHELGHIFGLDHSTDPADLMYPTLNKALTGPQPGDITRIRAEYGPPENTGPTVPVPGYKEYTIRVPENFIVGYNIVGITQS